MSGQHHTDTMRWLREERAAAWIGRAVRVLRKIDSAALPYVQPPGTRRKDQRLYRAGDLDAWREAHGTWQEAVGAVARATHTKLRWHGEGYSKSPHYNRWRKMVARCTDPNHPDYENYGGRGIKVHEPWIYDPIAFFHYLESRGPIPKGYSLDRKDNDGDYEPGNLRFVDKKTQNQNRRSWADLDSFAPCCWCIDCNHDAVTCPIEALDWRTSRLVLGTEHGMPFDWFKARKDYGRTRLGPVIDLPGPEIETRNRFDEIAGQYELDRWLRDFAHL
ncbi:MAG: hypothetical protein QM572_19480 [Nocardioides sp.]|uniref:hypothetical protein n=1 Tax=Nocardioides sp. TaxID=35761 RepID=UPI0039E41CB1